MKIKKYTLKQFIEILDGRMQLYEIVFTGNNEDKLFEFMKWYKDDKNIHGATFAINYTKLNDINKN